MSIRRLPGFPRFHQGGVVVVPFNDLEAVKGVFAESDDIVAIILGQVNFNSGASVLMQGTLKGSGN